MTFDELQSTFTHRMTYLRATFDRQGYLFARSRDNPAYSILLHASGTSDAPWAVHSFYDGQPACHRDYDRLEGGSATQNAFQEFVTDDMVLSALLRPPKGVEWSRYTVLLQRSSAGRGSSSRG